MDVNFTIYCIGDRDGKKEKMHQKKAKRNLSILIFFSYNKLGHSQDVKKNLKTLALLGTEKTVTKNKLERKKIGQTKGMISRRLILFLHHTTSHTQHLYQISKS